MAGLLKHVPHATNKIEYIRNAKLYYACHSKYYAFWVQKILCRLESVIGKIIKMDISLLNVIWRMIYPLLSQRVFGPWQHQLTKLVKMIWSL